MYSVNLASDPERFYLRLLLLNVKGACSFQDLRTVNKVEHPTFAEAAKAMGLIKDETVWEQTLADAIVSGMPKELRELFVTICVFVNSNNAKDFWEAYKDHLCKDFTNSHLGHQVPCRQCEQLAMREIKDNFILHGKRCEDFNLLSPPVNIPRNPQEYFNVNAERETALLMSSTLNDEQQSAFDEIIESVNQPNLQSRCFFLDGPGGSGKTYLYRTLLSQLRGQSYIALPVASTGIAANLLSGGWSYISLTIQTPSAIAGDCSIVYETDSKMMLK